MYAELISAFAARDAALEIIDEQGRHYKGEEERCRFCMEIRDRRFYRSLLWPDACSIGEAYTRGYFTVSDIVGFLEILASVAQVGKDANAGDKIYFYSRLFLFSLRKLMAG